MSQTFTYTATAKYWAREASCTMLRACLNFVNLMQNIHMIQKPRKGENGL